MNTAGHRSEWPARTAPGRPPVDNAAIIETALQIVDEEGAAALSMRTLAQRMNSSTATLYRHFPNRSALVSQVVDRVLGEVDLDPADFQTPWRQALGRLAHAPFEALGRHRNLAPLLAEHLAIGRNAMNLLEHFYAVMLHHQFPPETTAPAAVMINRCVLGFATQFVTPPATIARIAAVLDGATMDDFPATASLAHLLPVGPVEKSFDLCVETILDGLESVRQREGLSRSDGDLG